MSLRDEDTALIAAALNGSAHAWEKLVRRHESRIYNLGLRLLGNSSDAMDLVQEVFLGVYRNLHRFRGDAKFSSWIFRISHNKAMDLNRRRQLVPVRSGPDGQDILDTLPAAAAAEPEQAMAGQQRNREIIAMLAELPMEQRLVVELKVFQSLTFEEIAELQDLSANTAKTRFYTALKKLKSVAEENHVVPQD